MAAPNGVAAPAGIAAGGRIPLRSTVAIAAVAASTGALLRFGVSGRTAVALVFFALLAVLSVTDFEQRRLPNSIVLPGAALILAAQIAVAPDRTLEWVLGAIGGFVVLLFFAIVHPPGLGMGDVKLALLLGAALGKDVILGLLIGSGAAGAYGLALMARHGLKARRADLPFGPFLALGAAAAYLLG